MRDAQEASGKGDKGTEGKNAGLRDTVPTQACLWESDECSSFLICLSIRKVWLSVWVLQHESSPSQKAVIITKSLFLDWNWLLVQFKDLTQGVSLNTLGGAQLQVQSVELPVKSRMLLGEGDTTSVLNFTYIGLLSSLLHLLFFKVSIWYLPPSQSLHALQTQAHKWLKQFWNKTSRI